MKAFLKLSLLFIFLFIPRAECKSNSITITSYNIKLNYSSNNKLQILADVTLYKKPFDQKIFFLIDSNMGITDVRLAGLKNSIQIPFVKNNDTLDLKIPSAFSKVRVIHLAFTYVLKFDSLNNGVKTIGFWYPYLWNNISKFNVITNSPHGYMILFPGIILKKDLESNNIKCIWETDKPIPRLFMVIAKTKAYAVSKKMLNGKAINYYFLTKDKDLLQRFKKESLNAFEFFSNYLGGYRYKNLTFIEVPDINFINSQPTFIMIGSAWLNYYKKNLYDWPPHEIAHQWFASGIFSKHYDLESWCIYEPLAEYLRLTFTSKDSGKVFMEKEIKGMIDEYKSDYMGTKDDKPLIESGASRVTYLKGTYVMNVISQICGQQKWRTFLEKLYSNFKGKFMTYDDFINSLYNLNHNAANIGRKLFTTLGINE